MLRLAEVFVAVQGEGTLVGTPSVFVRTHGCNLSCEWCDTPETSIRAHLHAPDKVDVDDLSQQIRNMKVRHVVFTGGEPMLQAKDLYQLAQRLPEYHITIETNGVVWPKEEALLEHISLFSLSPKLQFSKDWKTPYLIAQWAGMHGKQVQVKIVVSDMQEVTEAILKLRAFGDIGARILQPEFGKGPEWAKAVAEHVVNLPEARWLRVLPQMHRYINVR